jgi:hypothetical protein
VSRRCMTTRLWSVGLLLFAPIACSSDNDKSVRVVGAGGTEGVGGNSNAGGSDNTGGATTTTEVLPCSTTNPAGACETSSTCIDGTCQVDAVVCSSTNPGGLCATGKACYQGACVSCSVGVYSKQLAIGVDTKTKLAVDGLEFKDSSGDGKLDAHEDWRLPEICRARDLVSKMSNPEKVGLMSETSSIGSGSEDGSVTDATKAVVQQQHQRQALIRLGSRSGQQLANYTNSIQKLCEAENWGVPFVVTTDPSHGFSMSTSETTGAQSLSACTVLSPWPQPLGIGAINRYCDQVPAHQRRGSVRNAPM